MPKYKRYEFVYTLIAENEEEAQRILNDDFTNVFPSEIMSCTEYDDVSKEEQNELNEV